MTPERWRQVEDLYHSALKRPPQNRASLLRSADPEVRREVESLLAQQSRNTPLDRPAWGGSAAALETRTPIGPYRIEAQLGEGGAGVGYRALDTRLNRPVAVKLLTDGADGAAAAFSAKPRWPRP